MTESFRSKKPERFHRHEPKAFRPERVKVSEGFVSDQGETMSGGSYGNVMLHPVHIKARGFNKSIEADMAVKKYHGHHSGSPEDDAKRAFAHYIQAAKAGLAVLPDFWLIENKAAVAMTDWSEGGKYVAFSGNERGDILKVLKDEVVEKVINMAELVKNVFDQAELATLKKIHVPEDAYMFRFVRGSSFVDIDVAVVDVDFVASSSNPYEVLRQQNYKAAEIALKNALVKFPVMKVSQERTEEELDEQGRRYYEINQELKTHIEPYMAKGVGDRG